MQGFEKYYFIEKTIDTNKMMSPKDANQLGDPEDVECAKCGLELAQKYNLLLNGWMENNYYFTIPEDQECGKNTFAAKNEKELIERMKKYQPTTFKEPFGKPDEEVPTGCDYIDIKTPEGRAKMFQQLHGEN